jgi:hypothetical protein
LATSRKISVMTTQRRAVLLLTLPSIVAVVVFAGAEDLFEKSCGFRSRCTPFDWAIFAPIVVLPPLNGLFLRLSQRTSWKLTVLSGIAPAMSTGAAGAAMFWLQLPVDDFRVFGIVGSLLLFGVFGSGPAVVVVLLVSRFRVRRRGRAGSIRHGDSS